MYGKGKLGSYMPSLYIVLPPWPSIIMQRHMAVCPDSLHALQSERVLWCQKYNSVVDIPLATMSVHMMYIYIIRKLCTCATA